LWSEDIGKEIEEYHDLPSTVRDLRELIIHIASNRRQIQPQDIDKLRLFLAGNSMGCVVARMYAHTYSRTVLGVVLMDCAPSIRNPEEMIPDPDAADFQLLPLPDGVTVELLRRSKVNYAKSLFNPYKANQESLNWRNLIVQLPLPNEPKLVAPDGGGPFLTIIKNDPVVMIKHYKK
jgi:pimeloyl-ACP methyl ester carboxylesterase